MHGSESNPSYDAAEKTELRVERHITPDAAMLKTEVLGDDGEVFKSHTGKVEFRALGW